MVRLQFWNSRNVEYPSLSFISNPLWCFEPIRFLFVGLIELFKYLLRLFFYCFTSLRVCETLINCRSSTVLQVSRTLRGINNVVVKGNSTRALISNYTNPFTSLLVNVKLVSLSHSYLLDFQFSSKVSLFAFFQFYTVISRDGKIRNSAYSLFRGSLLVRSSGWDMLIRLYLKIPEKFLRLIL